MVSPSEGGDSKKKRRKLNKKELYNLHTTSNTMSMNMRI
jgi:hypothetical protein